MCTEGVEAAGKRRAASTNRPKAEYCQSSCRAGLLICGEHNGTGNIRSAMERWSERDPDSEFHVIPGAGHVADPDRPDEVNRLTVAFLKA